MVEDPKLQHLIRWHNTNGGFVVVNPDEFARDVLAASFKHNNFASFVRQLNMYGFHKVNDLVHTGDQCWEFSHPSFQRGKKELLFDIKRRVPSSKLTAKGKVDQDPQEGIEEMLERIDKLEADNTKLLESFQTVAAELVGCKQFIMEQRVAINQIIQYLGSNPSSDPGDGRFSFLFYLIRLSLL